MEQENEFVIRTVADELLDIIKKNKKMTLNEASALLNLQTPLLETIVEFFVEARILEWDYHFTTPTIILHKEAQNHIAINSKKHFKDESQFVYDEFLKESKENNSDKKIPDFKKIFEGKPEVNQLSKSNSGWFRRRVNYKSELDGAEEEAKLKSAFENLQQIAKEDAIRKFSKGTDYIDTSRVSLYSSQAQTAKTADVSKVSAYSDQAQTAKTADVSKVSAKTHSLDTSALSQVEELVKQKIKEEKMKEAENDSALKYAREQAMRKEIASKEIKDKLEGMINDSNRLLMEGNMQDAGSKYKELLIYFISLDPMDKDYLKKIISLTDKFEEYYGNLRNVFYKDSLEIQKQILMGKIYLAKKQYQDALDVYKNISNMESRLPDSFAGGKRRIHSTVMKYYADVAGTMAIISDSKFKDINSKILSIIGTISSMQSAEEMRGVLSSVMEIYAGIPAEFFDHKIKLSHHMLKIFSSCSKNNQISSANKAKINFLMEEVNRALSGKNLLLVDSKYLNLMNYVMSLGCTDESFLSDIFSLQERSISSFGSMRVDSLEAICEIEKKIMLARHSMIKKNYEKAAEALGRASSLIAGINPVFSTEKKKLRISLIRLYVELEDMFINLKENNLESISHRIISLERSVSEAKPNTLNSIIPRIFKLYDDFPAELFEHKYKISKKVLSMCGS